MIEAPDDTPTVQAIPVLPETAAEREAATRAALASHKASCAARADVYPCQTCRDLTAAWRRALRGADSPPVQITTDPPSR